MVIRNAVRMMKTMCQTNVHFLYKRSFVTLKMTADWMSPFERMQQPAIISSLANSLHESFDSSKLEESGLARLYKRMWELCLSTPLRACLNS